MPDAEKQPDSENQKGSQAVGSEAGASADPRFRLSRRELLRFGGVAVGGATLGGLAGWQLAGGGPRRVSSAAKTWKVGAVIPKKNPYLGEGQETSRGLELGVKVLNGRGGLVGRPVELVTEEVQDLSAESMVAAAQSLVAQEVAAVFLGFASPDCAEFATYGEYGAPVFHLVSSEASLTAAASLDNVFRCVPAASGYGKGIVDFTKALAAAGALPQRTMAILTGDDADGSSLAADVRAAVGDGGWDIAAEIAVPSTTEDWPSVVEQLRGADPGLVFLGIPHAPQLAAFQAAFVARPFPALLYATAAASVPEFLSLAGEAADGMVWSTPIGTLTGNAASAGFEALYGKKYGKSAFGLSQIGANYDMVLYWAQCAALAKRPSKFSAVGKNVPQQVFRGVSGSFIWDAERRAVLGYPTDTEDFSLGLPHLIFQVQGGQQVRLGPAPFKAGGFKQPNWT